MNHKVIKYVEDGDTKASLQIPLNCPAAIVGWAKAKAEEDLKVYANTPPRSYLQQALELGRSISEAVDAKVRASVFAEPTRTYREHLVDVLREAYNQEP
jgi:hypothetical protein